MKRIAAPVFLIISLLIGPPTFAHGWQAAAMWDWALNTANPKFDALEADVATLQSQVASLQSDLATATAYIDDLQSYVSVDDTSDPTRPVVTIAGANLQIVNGLGNTLTTNGVGNLIVGYDENMSFLCFSLPDMEDRRDAGACSSGFWLPQTATKTGSHNLIIGDRHSYTSYSAIVSGTASISNSAGGSVLGGAYNTASGAWSSISGGVFNIAEGRRSSISGGSVNTVDYVNATDSGNAASISGGTSGTISGVNDWLAGTLFEDD
jgi:hypothetical protein